MRRTLVLVTALTTLATGALAALQPGAGLASEPGGDRYGLVRNILPPGSRGNATALDLLQVGPSRTASPTTPKNFADQLEMYDALTKQAPGSITAGDLDRLYKTAGFTPEEVVSAETPRDGVTIQRDQYGVPFITGTTLANVEYGAGYAAVQDRMFLMDAL
ncbi:MAG TPA: penicillin acylase family protein, partial [Nocardioides sp.]